ncbi:MAG TPA: ACT domain-containing protein [Tepidisphaeraceae bacterium]|jgi:glycine cleavage system transcriptional repressor|nr:ACT domain-containing protein [Tepidisphaeraceae bacterium]
MSQLIITAVGPDRPGIVGELSGHLHSAGGNILDSRMVNLRGQFAIVILIELAESAAAQLQRDLPGFGKQIGLNLSINSQTSPPQQVQGLSYRLKTYSGDQPGIVARLTNLLRGHGVNIEELTGRQESAAFAGTPIFITEMRLTVPPGVALRKLRSDLEGLCNELNCDVDLEPAEA